MVLPPPGSLEANRGGPGSHGLGSEARQALNVRAGYFTNGKCEAHKEEETYQSPPPKGRWGLIYHDSDGSQGWSTPYVPGLG